MLTTVTHKAMMESNSDDMTAKEFPSAVAMSALLQSVLVEEALGRGEIEGNNCYFNYEASGCNTWSCVNVFLEKKRKRERERERERLFLWVLGLWKSYHTWCGVISSRRR